MEHLSILYYSLTLVFSGFVAYAVVLFAFMFFKMPRKETFAPLFLCFVSFLYIASDVIATVFTFIMVRDYAAFIFLSIRELLPLAYFFIVPYYLDRVLDLEANLKKINRIISLAGIAIALGMAAYAVVNPGLLLEDGGIGSGLYNVTVNMHNRGPLIIIRNVLFSAYLAYLIIIILMTAMQRERKFTGKNVLAGLLIVIYFAFNNLYSILFAGGDSFNKHFPDVGLGIVILLLFMSFGLLGMYINRFSRLDNKTKYHKSELYYDTGVEIQNKIAFRLDLNNKLDNLEENGGGFSLIYFDVDDFQNVNESYGESFGDEILIMLSSRLQDAFPQAGTLYRVGGDEFSFLLKDVKTEDEAGNFAFKLLSSMKNPFIVAGVSYTLTVSIAILLIPRDGTDMDTIMSNAYTTIRSVKKTKKSYQFFDRDLLEKATNKIYTVDLLRNCISRDEFVLFYQPVVDADGKLIYAEALLRCTNADPTIGGPDNFIPLIEKAGLMKDLDNLVVRKAFYDLDMKFKKRINVSINMSASQLIDPSYGDFLSLFAKQHGIEPRQIILEITETNLMANMLLARKSLTALKNYGFIIAIDDFGKGFSSLSYLAELPVDIMKIDMAFVHAVPGDAKKETMAKYIMDLGHSLNLKVVAEGFELPEQVEFFKGLGCDLFQGYYFSRPMPLKALLAQYFPE